MAKAKAKGRAAKGRSINDRGIVDFYNSFVEKVTGLISQYGAVKDIFHLVQELAADEEVVTLAKKIASCNDKEMYVLLAAAILRVVKEEMEDGDGILDYDANK